MNNHNDGLYTLNQIFTNKIFRVPDYQRGYSWKEKEVSALWEDIENISNEGIHYTGMITVQKPSKRDMIKWHYEFNNVVFIENSYKIEKFIPLYIADGQQRLTSLMLLLTAIRDTIKLEEEKKLIEKYIEFDNMYLFGYEIDTPSYEFLKKQIYANPTIENSEKETNYTENLRKAKAFFDNKLTNYSKEDIEIIYNKVTEKLLFNYYEIPDNLDIFTIFETMNYRGKALSNLELLKNRLIYLIAIYPVQDDEYKDGLRRKVNDAWTIVYQELARNKKNILNDDDYLRVHWFVYFNQDGKNGNDLQKYKQNLLDEHFVKNNVLCDRRNINHITLEDILNYVESLKNYVTSYYEMKNPDDNETCLSHKSRYWLSKIGRVYPKSYFEPMILALLVIKIEDSLLEKLLENIERYIFLMFGLGEYRSNTNKVPFLIEANKIIRGKDLQKVINKLKPEFKGKDDTLKTGEPKVNIEPIANILDAFNKNRQKSRSDEGFVNWKFIKYFMLEYDEYLQYSNPEKEYMNINKPNLELVFPAKRDIPKRDQEKFKKNTEFNNERAEKWKTCLTGFGEDGGQQYLTYTLGNIVLTSRDKKETAQGFIEKKDRYSNGTLSEQEIYEELDWTPIEILKRGVKLLVFMEGRWNIKIDFQYKKELLFLNRLGISDNEIVQKDYKVEENTLFTNTDNLIINAGLEDLVIDENNDDNIDEDETN